LREGRPYEFESEIIRPDGTRRTIFARGEPVPGGNGEVVKHRGMVLDITERSIALTGYGAVRDIEMGKAAGFAEHITKPVDFASLKAAIARCR
jgi:hypothetical protein